MMKKTKMLLLLCLTSVMLTSTACSKIIPAADKKTEKAVSKNKQTEPTSGLESKYVPSAFTQTDVDSDTVQWFCTAYAIYTEINNKDQGYIGGTSEENEEWYQDSIKEALLSGWSISGRDSALQTLNKLIDKGHRSDYCEFLDALNKRGLLDLSEDEFVSRASEQGGEVSKFQGAYRANQALGYKALDGWDYCRALQVLGDCYQAGYLNLEECLDISLEVSKRLQSQFDNWEQVVQSYLYGFYYWKGDDYDTESRWETYQELLALKDGPYSVPFDTKLKESWKNVTPKKTTEDPEESKPKAEEEAAAAEKENGIFTLYNEDKTYQVKVRIPAGFEESTVIEDQHIMFHTSDSDEQQSHYIFYYLAPATENVDQDILDGIYIQNQLDEGLGYTDIKTGDVKTHKVKNFTVKYISITANDNGPRRKTETWVVLENNTILQCNILETSVEENYEFVNLEDAIEDYYSGIQQ